MAPSVPSEAPTKESTACQARRLIETKVPSPFFATHPLAEDRIAETEALIAAYPASQLRGLRKDAVSFQTFRRRLLALPPPPAVRKP